MASQKFDPKVFFSTPEAVAALADESELFSFLNRKLDLPPDVAALITRNGSGQTLCPPGGTIDADGVSAVLFVRTSSINLAWSFDRMDTADHFQANVQVKLRLRPAAERGELISLSDQLIGSRRFANAGDVETYLSAPIYDALLKHIKQKNFSALSGDTDVKLAVKEAIAGPCFEAGLLIEDEPEVSFASKTFDQVRNLEEQSLRKKREQAIQNELNAALAQARSERLAQVEELLNRLKKLSDESPEVELPDLVRSFSETQRGQIYEALFAASARQSTTRWIVVAAGNELIFYEPTQPEEPARRLPMTGDAGPVRSVQALHNADDHHVLLTGASRGVYLVDEGGPGKITTYSLAPDLELRGGVNAAARSDSRLYATHSEVGLIGWALDQPDHPQSLLPGVTRNAQAVRGVICNRDQLYFSVNNRVIAAPESELADSNTVAYAGSTSLITAICPTAAELFAGNAEGQVLRWPIRGGEQPEIIHAGARRPVESLHLLPTGGISRLVFTDTTTAIHAKVSGDAFASRYEAGGQTILRVEAAADLLVGTNEVRDRLLLFRPDQGQSPIGTISVSREVRRSIQDVCLL